MKPPQEPTPEQLAHWEKRAPGWQVRCLKCGHTQHWGKYGIRHYAFGKKYTFGFCSQCRWIRICVVEKKPGS